MAGWRGGGGMGCSRTKGGGLARQLSLQNFSEPLCTAVHPREQPHCTGVPTEPLL